MKQTSLTAAALAATIAGTVPAWAQETFHCKTTDDRVQVRIVGGQQTRIDDWPWQVLVRFVYPSGRRSQCGGSIIAPRWVLTAAHCFFDDSGTYLADYGGAFSIVYGQNRPLHELGIPADRVIPHEGYDRQTGAHDIGLIRLTENIPASQPIQLSSERLDAVFARPGVCATVTGWGTTSEGGRVSEALRRADLPITTNHACREAYQERYPDQVTTRNICAGYKRGGVDSCQGDSGGPLVVQLGDSGRYVQVGVVSWGIGCARSEYPGVYTRVSRYIDWIQSHTGP